MNDQSFWKSNPNVPQPVFDQESNIYLKTTSSIHIKWLLGKFKLFKWERTETLKLAQRWCCSTPYFQSLIHNLSNTRILCSLPSLPAKHKFCDFLPHDLGFSSHSKKRRVAQKLWYPKHFFSLMRHKEGTLKVKTGTLYLVFFLFATEKLFSYFLFSIVKKSLYIHTASLLD